MTETISPGVVKYVDNLHKELDNLKARNMAKESENFQMSAFQTAKDPNLVEYQLDLTTELDRIYHLLSGHRIIIGEGGNEIWDEPKDDRLKIFSEYGVDQIMNIISFYINRNTLLSHYDEQTIKWKLRDFGVELADLIFNRYEVFFYYPTPEELYDKYKPIINKKGLDITDEELYQKCIQWSKEELQNKIRHYPMMVLALIDAVHSTYNRAMGGRERESLRRFMHVSQNTGGPTEQLGIEQQKFKLMRPKTW